MPNEPAWTTWHLREPTRTILESIVRMASVIREHTGDHGLVRVALRRDLGVRMGIEPGAAAEVSTSAGIVEVYCEP